MPFLLLTLKYNLPFATQPIVTDATYKAVASDKKYLCSSVIYVPEMRKSIVFFQAVIGSLEASTFATYFIKLFEHINVAKDRFLGVVMDFSAAQRLGFLHAFNYHYHNSANGSGTPEQLNEGISYFKGCHMHWMQSVQRVVKNHSAVPPQMKNEFLALA